MRCPGGSRKNTQWSAPACSYSDSNTDLSAWRALAVPCCRQRSQGVQPAHSLRSSPGEGRRGTPLADRAGAVTGSPVAIPGCSTGAPEDVAGSRAHAAAGSGGTSCSHAADGAARRLHRECCQSLHGDALPCAGDAAVGERRGTVQLPAGGRWPDQPFVPLRAWNRHCRGARASVSRVRRGLGGHG